MIRLPKKLLFAIEAVLDIAYNAGSQPIQSREITARQGIPRRYLEQVLQQLVRAKILSGVRGPRGGYRLARERRRITIGDIARVVDANTSENGAENSKDAPGSTLGQKIVWPLWHDLQDDMISRLDTVTIEELCRKANDAGIDSEAANRLDFII